MSDAIPTRGRVDRLLSQPTTNEEWDLLRREGYIGRAYDENTLAFNAAGVAEKVQTFRDVFGRSKPARRMPDLPPRATIAPNERREEVLAILLAAHARHNEAVQAFRQEVLGGKLLAWEDVERWLGEQRQAAVGQGMDVWVRDAYVPRRERRQIAAALERRYDEIPQGAEQLLHEGGERPSSFTADSVPMLLPTIVDAARIDQHLVFPEVRCLVPDPETGVQVIGVSATKGVLERLHQLGEQLATTYGWDGAEAVCFVLTDRVPTIAAFTAQIHIDEQLPVRSRILLTIDPTLLPAKVTQYYRQVRHRVLGRRYRELSDKHLALARFAASRPPDEPEPQRMAAWNSYVSEAHPKWRYVPEGMLANFVRDSRQAQERLLYPDLHQPSDEE